METAIPSLIPARVGTCLSWRPHVGVLFMIGGAFLAACGGDAPPTPTPLQTSTPTPVPSSTPAPLPTSTPIPREVSKFTNRLYEVYDEKVREEDSYCYVGTAIKKDVDYLSTHNVNYLRSYLKIRDLSAVAVLSIIDSLEAERGRYERLCVYQRGNTLPKVKRAVDIKRFYHTAFEETRKGNNNCELARDLTKLASVYSYSNINYVRSVFDAPGLTSYDISELAAHFAGEAGRYARLCDQGRNR